MSNSPDIQFVEAGTHAAWILVAIEASWRVSLCYEHIIREYFPTSLSFIEFGSELGFPCVEPLAVEESDNLRVYSIDLSSTSLPWQRFSPYFIPGIIFFIAYGLCILAIALDLKKSGRVLGLHFFSLQ
jgi:hypothetical protein